MPKQDVTHQNIEDTASILETCKKHYLRQAGWKETCDTPGSYWVWVREHDGKQLMADLDLAVGMQHSIESDNMPLEPEGE